MKVVVVTGEILLIRKDTRNQLKGGVLLIEQLCYY